MPTDVEQKKVAEPAAAILVRHCGTAFLSNDLVDGIRCAAGVTSYVQTSPLRRVGPREAEDQDAAEYAEAAARHPGITVLEPL